MPFRTFKQLANAVDDGGLWYSHFIKTSGPVSVGAGRWCDLSMGSGTPKYNAYVGNQTTATPLVGAGNDGIYVGPTPASGKTKHLLRLSAATTSTTLIPAYLLLADYLLHYPLIDGDSLDQQDMDNAQTLPRYATGEGVQCALVCTTPMSVNAGVTVTYTNSKGTTGQTTTFNVIASSVAGGVVSASNTSAVVGSVSPFIPLANGDFGIRSIQSVTFLAGAGGFVAAVLMRPLVGLNLYEAATMSEVNLWNHHAKLPRVYDGAYLHFLYLTAQSGTPATLRGHLETVWR